MEELKHFKFKCVVPGVQSTHMDTHLIWTVCFVLGERKPFFSKFNLLNTDIPSLRTLSIAPLVSLLRGVALYNISSLTFGYTVFIISAHLELAPTSNKHPS